MLKPRYINPAVSTPSNAAAFAPLWTRILAVFPSLRSEYIQVLVFLGIPLAVFVAVLIANLAFRRSVLRELGSITFRPSLAIRVAWILSILALLGNLLIARHHNWFLVITNLLAVFELARTFPRNLTIDATGLQWRTMIQHVMLRWENISAFAPQRSLFGTDYKVYGNEDQVFVINSMENPDWRKIVQSISRGLAHRQLNPSLAPPPHNFLESLHRVLLPASILITYGGPYLPHF